MLPAPKRFPDTVDWIMLDAQDLSMLSMESRPSHSRNPQQLIAVYLQQGKRVCCCFISFQAFKAPIHSARQQGNRARYLQGEKRDSAHGKSMCSLVSVSRGRNLVISETATYASQLGHGAGKTKWKTLTTAEGSAETFGPVHPSLIPAQDSNLIKFLFNPWIFFLGDE